MWEVVLILVVALIVLGPRQLTEVARALGKMYREVQKLASDVRSSVDLDALTRPDEQPDAARRNYEPPPPVKDLDLTPPPGEKSGPDFYADLLESSKEDEDKPAEQAGEQGPAHEDAKPEDAESAANAGESDSPGKEEATPKEVKTS